MNKNSLFLVVALTVLVNGASVSAQQIVTPQSLTVPTENSKQPGILSQPLTQSIPVPLVTPEPEVITPEPDIPDEMGQLEYLVGDLYNALITADLLPAPRLPRPSDVWSRDFAIFQSAFGRYLAANPGGVFLTSRRLYNIAPSVQYQNGEWLLAFPEETVSLGPPRGISSERCQIVPVIISTPNLVQVLGANAQCVYATALNTFLRNEHPGELPLVTNAALNRSGTIAQVETYFNELRERGLIRSYVVDAGKGFVDLELPNSVAGQRRGRYWLALSMLNLLTGEEERRELDKYFQEGLEDTNERILFYARPDWREPPRQELTETLARAIKAVTSLNRGASPAAKKTAFMRSYGYEPEIGLFARLTERIRNFWFAATGGLGGVSPSSTGGCDPSAPVSYPPGTVTPANKCVTYFEGLDPNGFTVKNSFWIIANGLVEYGYHVRRISGRYLRGRLEAARSFINQLVSALRKSQTLILNVHGDPDGGIGLACFQDVPFGGKKCCQTVKEISEAVSPGSARDLDCNILAWRYETNAVYGFSTGSMSCSGRPVTEANLGRGVGDRCAIGLKSVPLYSGGVKAALFTAQCFGGGCWPIVNGIIMDYWSSLHDQLSWAPVLKHDAELVKEDFLGRNQRHIRFPNIDIVSGFNWQREVQRSVATRGSAFSDAYEAYRNCKNLDANDQRYCAATVAGEPATVVEFAPSVASVDWCPGGERCAAGQFGLSFTSAVNPDEGRLDVDWSSCQPRSTRDPLFVPGEEPIITSTGASFRLNSGNFALMDRRAWEDPSRLYLKQKYGQEPSNNWPWYIEVTLSGVEAPSGIKLDGNTDSASSFWIWPWSGGPTINVPPWSNLRGKAGNGDPLKVKIPCAPQIVCGMPAIASPPGGGCPYRNGVLTASGTESVFTDPNMYPTPGSNPPRNPYVTCFSEVDAGPECGGVLRFPGQTKIEAEACTGDPNIPDEQEGAVCDTPVWYERCPMPPPPPEECARNPGRSSVAQTYISWTVEENRPAAFPPVRGTCSCGL